jgi:hypothetical protein
LYAFAANNPLDNIDPNGLQSKPAGAVSGWSYEQKLQEILTRAIPKLPGEIGAVLREMVLPENQATMGKIFSLWATLQATPAGWIADIALLGFGIWTTGSGVVDLFNAFIDLNSNTKSAKCEGDLDAAATRLANHFVTGSGEVVTGLGGTWGVKSSGGFTRIATGIRTVIDFGKRQIGKIAGPPPVVFARPNTGILYPNDMTPWMNPNGTWKYPTLNDGAKAPGVPTSLPVGTLFDRLGTETGNFGSPVGTRFSARALPPEAANAPYFVYKIMKPIPPEWVLSGETAEWFGQSGGGTQYKFTKSIDWLKKNGYIDEVFTAPKQ